MLTSLRTYSVIILSSVENLRKEVDEVLDWYCDICGNRIKNDSIFELKVILNELLINAMKHGNLFDPAKSIRLNASLEEGGNAVICIEDDGCGCDYKQFYNRNACYDVNKDNVSLDEAGRGIFIVKSLCDYMTYNEQGNRVEVIKKLLTKAL